MKKKSLIILLSCIIVFSIATGTFLFIHSKPSNELVEMLNNGEQIAIEVYTSSNTQDTQGTKSPLIWEQLALLETNPTLRKSWEDTLGIIGSQESKNGILYINESGEQDINNTLRVALHNTEFQKILFASASDKTLSALAEAVTSNYADIEITDHNNRNEILKAVYMGINGYFNLLPDNVPNYCNADSPITRAEFMAMVFRADTPVQELQSNGTFTNLVGQSQYNIYSQEVAENNSYLDIEYKGLNPKTYNSNITRAEVIYTLVSRYYNDELQLVNLNSPDIKAIKFTDCTNAGNIAADQKIIKDATTKEYWKSYELAYALSHADEGMPEEIYKAMIVAYQNGIIGTETRWDETATLSDCLELLIKAILNEKGLDSYTAKLGEVSGYEVKIEDDRQISDDNTTIEGNGAGEGAEIPEDFPYVDREIEQQQEEVVVEQPKQEEIKQDPVVEQPVQSANPPAGLGNTPTFSGVPTGTGDGSGAIGSFGNYQ